MNMSRILLALDRAGFDGCVNPDHIPILEGDWAENMNPASRQVSHQGLAYAIGYIKALLAALAEFKGRELAQMPETFSIAIVGHTGRGNYGHGLDMGFVGVEGARIAALADPDEEGRAAAQAKTGAGAGYADYREMLAAEKPDIAVLASREIGDHCQLVLDAAEAGCNIYLEKPVAASPAEVDRMTAACDKAGVLCVVAHPWRGHPPIQRVAIPMIRSGGKIGEPRLCRVHGMNGSHGGDQLFLDLYPHFFDFLWQLFGEPLWCHAHLTEGGRDAVPADLEAGGGGHGPGRRRRHQGLLPVPLGSGRGLRVVPRRFRGDALPHRYPRHHPEPCRFRGRCRTSRTSTTTRR